MAKSKKNEKEKLPKELTRNAWILVVGAIAPMLDSTMVNIAINKLQSDLHTSLDMIQWAYSRVCNYRLRSCTCCSRPCLWLCCQSH